VGAKRTPDTTDAPSLPSPSAPIIERAPLPLVEVEGTAHIVSYVNSAFCSLMGQSRGDLVGKSFAEVIPRGDECLPLLKSAYQTEEAVTHVQEDDSEADPAVWLYAMWPALDTNERPVGFVIQLAKAANFRHNVTAINEALLLAGLRQHELNAHLEQEITERKRVEEALRESERQLAATARDKDAFLAMLSHELRNPLASITIAAHSLRMVKTDDSTIVEAQQIIERQAHHLARLVDDLLEVSRVEQGKVRLRKEPMDLARAISRAVDSCEHLIKTQDHTISVDLQHIPPLNIEADPTRIDQVLINLIGNAAKYTPPHGALHIKAAREDGMAVVRVRDSGIGIEHNMLRNVFDLFTQVDHSIERSQGGLGLGLKLVKELVELHGGSVEARSEGLNRGSEFIVRLPLSEKTAPKPSAHRAVDVRGISKRILVVDDRHDNRDAMAVFLKLSGHSVEVAEDGLQAIEKALRSHPDVAFVDIGLPKVNGYDVAKEIRLAPGGETIVLIAVSGYGSSDDKRTALAAGFDAHLTKPFNPDEITKILNELEQFRRNQT
jgi:signal transduction histidine kinase/ActR/RegA family two-component response regulator